MISPSLFSVTIVLCLLTQTSVGQSVECLSTETVYALCRLNGTTPVIVSNNFTGEHLVDECHGHFIEDAFDESCPEITTAPETTTLESDKSGTASAKRYGYGFLAVFIVCALSLVGILAVPCIHKSVFPYVLALFTALAVGTLFGDAMFHLIPFAFGLHSHEEESTSTDAHGHEHRAAEHEHSETVPLYQWRSFVAVMVLYGFYLLEVLLNWISYRHGNKNSIHGPDHGHSHAMVFGPPKLNGRVSSGVPSISNGQLEIRSNSRQGNHEHNYKELERTSRTTNQIDSHVATESAGGEEEEERKIPRATGWMVIIGDAIHNFADGLAIGAAFSEDLMIGLTTTIAVACHELPHELGDYAVLIQAGFSRCRALAWNFVSATTAIIGFFVGAGVSTNENARQWIFAVTVGMFLYIALVDLLPTLLPHGKIEIRRFICVNVGFLIGIAIMFILAIYEDQLIESVN